MWPDEYRLPRRCCVCLEQPETTMKIEGAIRKGNVITSFEFHVPICAECLAEQSRRKYYALLYCPAALMVGICITVGLCYLTGGGPCPTIGPWGILLSSIGSLVVLLHLLSGKPASLELNSRRPRFVNARYQELFEQENGIDRAS
jgi:hypothetical protein